jgi:RimJ/RimL family protein N-acetyltransferase
MPGADRSDFARVRSPFEGSLVRLRAIEETDLARINAGIWNPNVTEFLSMAWPESVEQTRTWWERVRSRDDIVAFAIETKAGELVGAVSIEGISDRVRAGILGIWLAEPHWNRGYGTDAVRVACRFAFREMNLQRVGLSVYDHNLRGRRAYEKVGFVEEGRTRRGHFVDGGYHDVIEMGLLAEDLVEG